MEKNAGDTNDEALLQLADREDFVAHIANCEERHRSMWLEATWRRNWPRDQMRPWPHAFSLPEWDFGKGTVRKSFLQSLRAERPHFVWLAPPCK